MSAETRREVIRVNETRTNLLLFPTGEEVFYDDLHPGNVDVFIAGSAGSALSIDNNRLVFHTGHIFLHSGKSSLTVGTRLANIHLGAESTIALDIHPHKPLHIAVLSGTSPVHLKVKERRTPIMLKPGDELFVSDTVQPAEQYKASDPLPREEASKETETKGLELIKRTFDAHKLLDWHVTQINSKEKLSGNKKALLEKLHPSANTAANGNDRPSKDPWHVLAAGGSEFTLLPMGSGVIHLRSGELFIYSPDYAIVETPLGEVHGDKGALFAVDTANGNLRARALTGPGDVTVVTDKNKLPVPPGEEVLISDHQPGKEDTNPKDGIGRRNPSTRILDDKLNVTISDFSILSLLISDNYLKPIKKPFWAHEKSAWNKLIQTAVAIETITRSKGGYTAAPRATQPRQQQAKPGQAI